MTFTQVLGLATCALFSSCVIEHDLGHSPGGGGSSGSGSGSGSGAGYARFAQARWALTLGGDGLDDAEGIVTDSAGDVVAGGTFSSTVDFGDRAVSTTNFGAWVSKRAASDGHALWTKTFGTDPTSQASVSDIAILADDSVIAVGWFEGTITEGATTLTGPAVAGAADTFIIKLDRDGNVLWAHSLSNIFPGHIAVGPDGHMAFVGGFQGTLQLPNGSITSQSDNALLLVALDATATPLWGISAQGTVSGSYSLDTVAMTAENDIVVTGTVFRDMQLGPTTISPAATDKDAQYVTRFSIAGNLLWTHVIGDTTHEYQAVGVAAQSTSGLAVFSNSVDDSAARVFSPAVEAMQPSGTLGWTYKLAERTREYIETGATLADGGVVTSGRNGDSGLDEPFDLGQGPLAGCNYLARQDVNGALTGAIGFGNAQASQCVTVARLTAHASTSITLAGSVTTNVDLGTGSLRYAGGFGDAVIAVFDIP